MTILSVFHFQASISIAEKLERKLRAIALRILNSKVPLKSETVVLQPELIVRRSTQRRAAKQASSKVKATGYAVLPPLKLGTCAFPFSASAPPARRFCVGLLQGTVALFSGPAAIVAGADL